MMILQYFVVGLFVVSCSLLASSFVVVWLWQMSSAIFGKPKKQLNIIWFLNSWQVLISACTLLVALIMFLRWLAPAN